MVLQLALITASLHVSTGQAPVSCSLVIHIEAPGDTNNSSSCSKAPNPAPCPDYFCTDPRAALDLAHSSGSHYNNITVQLPPGIFYVSSPLVITCPLNFVGARMGSSFIDGANPKSSAPQWASGLLAIGSGNVT